MGNVEKNVRASEKYKLLVSDIDLTLINDEYQISERNQEMIARARDAGVDFMLCTGRLFGAARPYAKQLKLSTPLITSNGAVTMDIETGEILYGTPLAPDICRRIFGILDEIGIYYHFYTKDSFYTRKFTEENRQFQIMNSKLEDYERFPMLETDDPCKVAEQIDVYKICVRCPSDEAKEKFTEAFTKMDDVTISSSFSDNFEINAKGVDKGAAIARYAKEHGIKPEEIISFGDNKNDIEMISYAGVGVAVENAVSELKEAADFITKSNNESGVGEAIAHFVFGESI